MRFLMCDVPTCDHEEEVAAFTPDLIGKPCPKCGANLLTQQDYDDWHARMEPTLDALRALGILKDPASPGAGQLLAVNLHEEKLTMILKPGSGAEVGE